MRKNGGTGTSSIPIKRLIVTSAYPAGPQQDQGRHSCPLPKFVNFCGRDRYRNFKSAALASLPQFHRAAWQDETDRLLCGNMRLSHCRGNALMGPNYNLIG